MQSGAPTFGTPEPALVLYVDGRARPPARRPVPLRRQPVRLEDRRRPGRLRVRRDVPADDPRRRQLRPPRGRLARGRARRRLREVHPRRRPVRDGRACSSRASTCPRTARRSTRSARTARASTSSARAHTLANFETAFYRSEIADNNSFEQWQEDGALDAAQRANKIWKRMLAEYEAPPIDPGIDEALLEFIAQRKASMPGLRRLRPRCSSASAAGAARRRPAGRPSRAVLADPTFELVPLKNVASTRLPHLPPGATRLGHGVAGARASRRPSSWASTLQARGFRRDAAPLGADGPRPRAPRRPARAGSTRRGVDRAFVVGGDAEEPGEYPRRPVAAAGDGRDRPSASTRSVCPCYPQGHPYIPDAPLPRRARATRRRSSTT